jgi:hypothetical protein
MTPTDLDDAASPRGGGGSPWGRALKIVLLVLGLAVGGIVLASVWLGEEQQDLPFDYERFE